MRDLSLWRRDFPLNGPLSWLILIWIACVLQSLLVASREPLLAVALPSVVILGGLLWICRGYLPVLIVGSAFLVPFELGTGSYSKLNAAFVLTAAGVVVLTLSWFSHDGSRLHLDRLTLPLFCLGATSLVAFGAGWLRTSGSAEFVSAPLRAQVAGLSLFLLSIGAALLVLSPAVHEHHRKVLTFTFLGLGGIYHLRFLIPGINRFIDAIISQDAISGVFATWLVALALGQALLNKHLSLPWRTACGALVVLSLWSALRFNLAWSTGWLPPLVGVAALLWISSPRWGTAVLLIVVLTAGLSREGIWEAIMVGDQQYSLTTRWEALKIIYPLVLKSPLLGLGMANYYYTVALYPILGWYVPFSSHNNYVDLVAQTGFLGLFFLVWFSFEFLRMIWSVRGRLGDGFARALLFSCWAGWIGSLVAAGLADWLIPFVHNLGVAGFRASVLCWIFAGAAVATCSSLKGMWTGHKG